MGKRIFLDDERMPPDDGNDWIIARNFAEFGLAIEDIHGYDEKISFISFDYDLGIGYLNGMDCAQELIMFERCIGEILTENFYFYVHSQNPAGKEIIEKYMKKYLEFKKDE